MRNFVVLVAVKVEEQKPIGDLILACLFVENPLAVEDELERTAVCPRDEGIVRSLDWRREEGLGHFQLTPSYRRSLDRAVCGFIKPSEHGEIFGAQIFDDQGHQLHDVEDLVGL
jgi:hypothetical protein